jgi:hypothetical protein
MSTIQSSLTIPGYSIPPVIRALQTECDRAERGGKVDLKQLREKLQSLTQAFNKDSQAINGTRISPDIHKARALYKQGLDRLNARVTVLSAKATNLPAWVKPAAYTALAVAGVALMALATYTVLQPQSPQPQPDVSQHNLTEQVPADEKLLPDTPQPTVDKDPNLASENGCALLNPLPSSGVKPMTTRIAAGSRRMGIL